MKDRHHTGKTCESISRLAHQIFDGASIGNTEVVDNNSVTRSMRVMVEGKPYRLTFKVEEDLA